MRIEKSCCWLVFKCQCGVVVRDPAQTTLDNYDEAEVWQNFLFPRHYWDQRWSLLCIIVQPDRQCTMENHKGKAQATVSTLLSFSLFPSTLLTERVAPSLTNNFYEADCRNYMVKKQGCKLHLRQYLLIGQSYI